MNVKANQVSDAFKLSQQLASLHACVRMDDGESVYASKWYSTCKLVLDHLHVGGAGNKEELQPAGPGAVY